MSVNDVHLSGYTGIAQLRSEIYQNWVMTQPISQNLTERAPQRTQAGPGGISFVDRVP